MKLNISVRQLVDFVYMSGDLNLGSLSGGRMQQGSEGHRYIQKRKADNWQSEFHVKHTDILDWFYIGAIDEKSLRVSEIQVQGRIDGIYVSEDLTIISGMQIFGFFI
jgi:hypothetical protein